MKYIVELRDLPYSIIKSKEQYFDDMKEAQVKQAEVQVEIAEMQQDIQNEAQEQAAYDQQIAQDL
ncbi:hypothetical protein IKN40_07865 [bacterium]|nr:hypothetical protein [bacterium]